MWRFDDPNPLIRQVGAVWAVFDELPPTGSPARRDLAGRLISLRNWSVLVQFTDEGDVSRAAGMTETAFVRGLVSRTTTLAEIILDDSLRVLGPDHLATLDSRDSLALADMMNELAGRRARKRSAAAALFKENIALRQRLLGPDDAAISMSLLGLGSVHGNARRRDEAITLFEEGFRACLRLLGPGKFRTYEFSRPLAVSYYNSFRIREGITLLEWTVEGCGRLLGLDHPFTVNSRTVLGTFYADTGRMDAMIALHEKAVADSMQKPEPDRVAILSCRLTLALECLEVRKIRKAIGLQEQNVTESERLLGLHQDTLYHREVLANAYEKLGQVRRALALQQRNLDDGDRLFGSDHLRKLKLRDNLASSYQKAGRLRAAARLYRQNLAERERLLEAGHYDTLLTRDNLADTYARAGNLPKAAVLYWQDAAVARRTFPPGHPDRRQFMLLHVAFGRWRIFSAVAFGFALWFLASGDPKRALLALGYPLFWGFLGLASGPWRRLMTARDWKFLTSSPFLRIREVATPLGWFRFHLRPWAAGILARHDSSLDEDERIQLPAL